MKYNKMEASKWSHLKNPPIVLAAMEIRYQSPKNFDINQFKKFDKSISNFLPTRKDNFHGNINLPNISNEVTTAEIFSTKTGFTYESNSKLQRLIVSKDNLIFVSEGLYEGWQTYLEKIIKCTDAFSDLLQNFLIKRVSLRFVNRISVPNEMESPLEYFNTVIHSMPEAIEHPIDSYFIRYNNQIPNTKLRTNIIQALDSRDQNGFHFIFDIDILDFEEFSFNKKKLTQSLNKIREEKNKIFFNNITDKTLKLYEQ